MDKKLSLNGFSLTALSLLFGLAIIYLGYVPKQNEFAKIILPYIVVFAIYIFFAFRLKQEKYFIHLLGLAILCRIILVFSFPNLSDDIYRFLWDAKLVLDGQNPYLSLPSDIVNSESQELFDQLNSQSYFSPYPPVSQFVYAIAAALSAGKIYTFSIIIKIFTIVAELSTFYFIIKLLNRLGLNKQRVFIYALNPLILIELMGNLHFESFMVCFMMGSVYFLMKHNLVVSSLSFIFAIASKLLPMMFAPFILGYLGFKKSIKFVICSGIIGLIVFIPVIYGVINGTFLASVGYYFHKFEFNGSIYYLLREFGYWTYGYNIIGTSGPILGIIALISICFLWFKNKSKINDENLFSFLLMTICIYLFSATTVHPWYVALPVVFCLFTEFRFPILWSGLIMLTYINYNSDPYDEKLLVVLLEYLLVFGYLFYELRKIKNKKASLN